VTYTNTGENPSAASRTVEITVNDGDNDSNSLSRDIDIIPVNDVPIISNIETGPLVYIENTGTSVISSTLDLSDIDNLNLNGAAVQISGNYSNGEDVLAFNDTATITHSWDPQSGTLTLSGTDTVASYQAALRSVTYTNTSDDPLAAPRTIAFVVTDTEQGMSAAAQREVQIVAVNDEPSGTDNIITALEDTSYVFSVVDFGFSDNLDNHSLESLQLASTPDEGTLLLDNTPLVAGDSVSRAAIDSGLFVYMPEENVNGSDAASFEFQVRDSGGTTNSGTNTDSTANTISIDVVSVNDAPNSTDSQITISEDTLHIFSPSDFPFADVDGDQFAGIVIGSLPDAGSLLLANNPVVAGEFISLSEIDDGDFVLIPMPGEPDNIISGFDYQVRDNGGTLNTGTDTSVSKNRIDFNVAGVNDAPQIVTNTASVDEGDELVITEEFLSGFDPDDTGPQELTFTVQNFPRNGELNLSGSELTTGDSFTLADIIAGRLSYEHDGSETETDQIEFSLADGGEDGASPSAGELSLLIREALVILC